MKKEYYTSLRNNNGKSQRWVVLKENGVVETMSASYSYSGTDGATCTLDPNKHLMSVMTDIDAVAEEYPGIYEEVFYHIYDSDQRDYGYVEVAIYCGEKANCPKKLIKEIENSSIDDEKYSQSLTDSASNSSKNRGYYSSPNPFGYSRPIFDEEEEILDKSNPDFERRCYYFNDLLERKGIFEVKSWLHPFYCSYYCDRNREKWHVRKPKEEDSSDYGTIKPIELPIYDEKALEDLLNKMIRRYDSADKRHELDKNIYEVVEQYKNRCNNLAKILEKLGVSRDIKRLAYFDKNGRQFEVIGPRVDDPEDLGSFRVAEKDVIDKDDGCDR